MKWLLLTLAIAACTSSTASSFVGDYTLQSVNGLPLPAQIPSSTGTTTYASGWAKLESNQVWAILINTNGSYGGGRWYVKGSTITLEPREGTFNSGTLTGTVETGAITVTIGANAFRFVR